DRRSKRQCSLASAISWSTRSRCSPTPATSAAANSLARTPVAACSQNSRSISADEPPCASIWYRACTASSRPLRRAPMISCSWCPSIRLLRRWGLLGMNGKGLGKSKSRPFVRSSRLLLAAYRGALSCISGHATWESTGVKAFSSQLPQQRRRLDGGHRRLEALVARIVAGAAQSLLDVFGGEHTERDRHVPAHLQVLERVEYATRQIVVVLRFATHNRPEADECIEPSRARQRCGEQRHLERARHVHHL